MPIDAGSIASELTLDTSKYMVAIKKAAEQMKNFEDRIRESGKKMETAISNLDKQYKLWQLSTNNVTKALEGKGKQVDLIKQKMGLLDGELEKNNKLLEEARQKYGANSEEVKELEGNILDLKVRQAELNQELKQFDLGPQLQKAGKRIADFGKSWTMKVTTPIVAAGTAAVVTTAKFDDQMSTVRAISGATGADFDKLRNQARELGRETRFSASEAAQGMTALAQMGFDVNEVYSAMPGMMDLAAAGALGLSDAAGITANTIRAFGLEAEQAGHVADVLAYAAANAGTDVQGMGQTMEYLAPIAKDMGWSLEESAAAAMALGDAGIYGAKAGAAFSTSLGRLAKPSDEAAKLMERLTLEFFDANGAMKPLPGIVGELEQKLADMTPQQKSAALTTLFGAEAYKHWSILVSRGSDELERMTRELETSDGAAKKMAEDMEDNLAGSWRSFMSAVSDVAIAMGDALIPTIRRATDKLTELARWFASLDPAIQTNIARIGALVAATGPALVIGGKLASGIGSIISLIGMFTPAAAGAAAATTATATAAGTAAKGFSLAGLAAKGGAALLNPWVLGIAAATVGGIALYRHLSQEAIPAVDLFGQEVSEATQQAVGGFLDLEQKATLALNQLAWSGQAVTQEMATGITDTFSQMNQQVLQGLDKRHKDSLESIQQFFTSSKGVTQEEQDKILTDMQDHHEQQKASFAEKEARIKEIMTAASNEKRALTREEQLEINTIQEEMKKTGIRVLSESEVEARVILERMKQQAGEITAQQAAEVVRNSLEQKEKAVAAAEEQYDQTVAAIIRQRDETGAISAEQAEKLIQEATRQRDEAVAKAEDMHRKVVEEAKAQAEEHVNQVDWETGEVKTRWEAMKTDIAQKAADIKKDTITKAQEAAQRMTEEWENARKWTAEKWESIKTAVQTRLERIKSAIDDGIKKIHEWNATTVKEKVFSIVEKIKRVVSKVTVGKNARGTDYWRGGLTWVGEEGPELVSLPRGTKIFSNPESLRMAAAAAASLQSPPITGSRAVGRTRTTEASPVKGGDINQYITINSPEPLTPSETARKYLQVSRQLAMEWGL